jgi:hypothetical protein
MVLLATKAASDPTVHAVATIGQPRGNPNIKPATVFAVL